MCRVVLVSLILLVGSVVSTNVSKCPDGTPFPLSVDIFGCDEPPCDVVKGTTAVMNVHFVGTKDNTRSITTKIKATTIGLTVPYIMPEENANVCKNLLYGAQCPIEKTEDVVYELNFYVDYTYPEVPVKVQASLVDEFGDTIACFVCPIRVKKGYSGDTNDPAKLE